MSSSKKKSKTHVISSRKKNTTTNGARNGHDVISKLDGLRSSVKSEHAKVDHPSSKKNYQIMAVVIIIVVGSAGLVFLYNPNVFTQSPPPSSLPPKFQALGGFKVDASASYQPVIINGKVSVVYVGGEFCPYCAVERWALVMALEHFGNFTNLGQITSDELSVPTYKFDGSSYTSSQVNFQPVEEYGNSKDSNGNYIKINSLNSLQQTLFSKYAGGYFPFVCIGGCLYQVGAGPNLNPSSFNKYTFSEVTTQISQKTGLYSVINAESNVIINQITEILNSLSSTTATSASTSISASM